MQVRTMIILFAHLKGKTMTKVASSSHRQNVSWKIFSTVDSSVHLNKPFNGRLEREKWNSKPPLFYCIKQGSKPIHNMYMCHPNCHGHPTMVFFKIMV